MTLTAKAASTARSYTVIKGDGFASPAFQVGGPRSKVIFCAFWDDSIDGHIPAAGSLGLGVFVPPGFAVLEVFMDVEVVPVGPTNVGFSLVNDFDLSASAAISGAPWSTVGLKHGAQADNDAVEVALAVQGPIVLTTPKEISIVGTGATSSAGRIAIWVEGVFRPTLLTQGAASGT